MKFSLKNKKEPVKNNKLTKKQEMIILSTIAVVSIICLCIMAIMEDKQGVDPNLVNIPISSENAVDENYKDVEAKFKEAGFTNITTEPVDDLITGIITKEYSVSEVSVDGRTNYTKGHKENKNAEVVIKYHTFKNATENKENSSVKEDKKEENTLGTEENPYTVENNADLKYILNNYDTKAFAEFGKKYEYPYITFDGNIQLIQLHEKRKYNFDLLLCSGDYDPDHQPGLLFKAEDENIHNVLNSHPFDVGDNVKITGSIGKYSEDLDLAYINLTDVEYR